MYSKTRILIASLLFIIVCSLSYKIIATNIELLDEIPADQRTPITSVKKQEMPVFQPSTFKTYDNTNTNIEYHDSPEKILLTEKLNDPITIKYSDGTSRTFRFGDVAGSATYYKTGAFKYGSKTYVPTYEDSVYLSKSHGRCSGITKTRIFSPEYYTTMNNICKTKTKNECKVSDSCVFLNDISCVVGDDAGPSLDSKEYKKDVDFFYYKNKCYGAC